MARTEAGTALTSSHLRSQTALRAATIRDIIRLYPMWDPFDKASYERFVQAVTLLAQSRAVNSAALAARYYEMFKNVDMGLTMGKAAVLASPASAAEIKVAIDATAVAGFWRGLGAGQTTDQALKNGLVQLTGAISREVLNGGRETIVNAVGNDSYVHGWIRVSDGDPCAFCAMLLSRGPQYLTFESAGNRSMEDVKAERNVDFSWHDHCGCGAEPFSEGSPWPEANQKYLNRWNETAEGDDQLNSFRRAMYANPDEKGVRDFRKDVTE